MLTDKEAKKFYNSSAWKEKRIFILHRDNYECQECRARLQRAAETGEILTGRERYIHYAQQVHHIKELKDFPELALADSNLESVCISCHNRIHGRDPEHIAAEQKIAKRPKQWEEFW